MCDETKMWLVVLGWLLAASWEEEYVGVSHVSGDLLVVSWELESSKTLCMCDEVEMSVELGWVLIASWEEESVISVFGEVQLLLVVSWDRN